MNEHLVEWVVPSVLFIATALVIWVFFYFRYQTRARVQETIQAALDKGAELTPELIDRMAGPKRGPESDFRRGLVAVAIGVAFAIFGLTLDEEEAIRPLIAVGTFPLLVGVAYLIMWRLGSSKEQRP